MFKDLFVESSLSKLWRHNEEHDCGAMTAFRSYNNCGYNDNGEPCKGENTPVKLTRKEKQKRNLALAADIKKLGYQLTKVIGEYPEGGKQVKEVSYFIVDAKDSHNLERDLRLLGEKYNQDSVLFLPKGTLNNDVKGYLIGTNRCCNNWLGYGKKETFKKAKIGYDSPIYTTKIHGRPFILENIKITDEIFGSGSNAIMADKFSQEIL